MKIDVLIYYNIYDDHNGLYLVNNCDKISDLFGGPAPTLSGAPTFPFPCEKICL